MAARLLIVNNVPSHYRTFMFNALHERGKRFGVEVEVAFHAATERGRDWNPALYDMRFPFFISTGSMPWRRTPVAYASRWNLGLDILSRARTGAFDWILLVPFLSAGNWLLARSQVGGAAKVLWSESNLLSAKHLRGPVLWFKRFLQAQFDALACPGSMARDYVLHISPELADRPVLSLPNIVDNSVYGARADTDGTRRQAARHELGIPDDQLLILGVGQLVDRKGFDLLPAAIASIAQKNVSLILIGEGPLKGAIERQIGELGLAGRVSCLGQKKPEQLATYHAAADWLIHPALADPSPLVVVEGVMAGLAMAVSRQTGNSREAVVEDENGFTFESGTVAGVAGAIERIATTDPMRLAAFHARSRELATERFSPESVVDRFFEDLLEIRNARTPQVQARRGGRWSEPRRAGNDHRLEFADGVRLRWNIGALEAVVSAPRVDAVATRRSQTRH